MNEEDDTSTQSDRWYFAYGANMSAAVLARRGITPRRSVVGRLDGWALRFSYPGLAWVEPAFANIEREDGERCYGVAHLLPEGQLGALDRFEGPAYEHRSVRVECEEGVIEAIAYSTPRPVRGRKPSRRYLGVCVEGARAHGVPEEYVSWLEGHRSAYVPVLAEMMRGYVWLLERLR